MKASDSQPKPRKIPERVRRTANMEVQAASLIRALVAADADAVVVDTGSTPYLLIDDRRIELSDDPATVEATSQALAALLPAQAGKTFERLGAVQCELPPAADFPAEKLTLAAVRFPGSLWLEIRRSHDVPHVEPAAPPESWEGDPVDDFFERPAIRSAGVPVSRSAPPDGEEEDMCLPDATELWPGQARRPQVRSDVEAMGDLGLDGIFDGPGRDSFVRLPPLHPAAIAEARAAALTDLASSSRPAAMSLPATSDLARLLRAAVARGAATLHVMPESPPAIRTDGEVHFLEGEQPLALSDVERLLVEGMPDAEAMLNRVRNGERVEWVNKVSDVGRVQSVSFRDHRGIMGIFRLPDMAGVSAEQLGLSPEVQALALEPEGLIVVSAPRSSGKSALLTAFVDLVNRLRRDYVITIEDEIHVAHESRGSIISQREVRGDATDLLDAFRTALREDPDVVVVEELRSEAMIRLALKAAAAGHLVIGGMPSRTAAGAVESILEAYLPEDRARAQMMLSEHLCGVVTQIMLRKPGGGQLVAREVMLNTPAVAKIIESGELSRLPEAIEAGRHGGMVSLDDTLADLVKSGQVDMHEAYRHTGDRSALASSLRRHGIDTSVLEPRAS